MGTSNRTFLGIIIFLQLCILVLLGLVLAGVLPQSESSTAGPRLTLFQQTINDASRQDPSRVVNTLFALNAENKALEWLEDAGEKRVKAVAWMNEEGFKNYYKDKEQATAPPENVASIWVTLVPQIQDFCKTLSLPNPTFRLKQYLGLDPNRSYERFMEVWVKPEDLFRPCPDPETADTGCNLKIDRENPPEIEGIKNYPAFYDSLVRSSYSPTGAPWTRLGYTYDWAYGDFGVGASEYIIRPGSTFKIGENFSTVDYCN